MSVIRTSAPSNIALIKYMGKTDHAANRPTNSSFSYTLDHLRTFVEISPIEGTWHEWEALIEPGLEPVSLDEKGKIRFLSHFQKLKDHWGLPGFYKIKSASNFPSDCGLASSASSFAALTLASSQLAAQQNTLKEDLFELATLSQKGSGSSCRSFFGPWVLWGTENVRPLEFPIGNLTHACILVESKKKSVSSSDAHKRVSSSALFMKRAERAEERLAKLLIAFQKNDWKSAFELTWSEFWDMHALFETSFPSFGYFEPGTIEVLTSLREIWNQTGDGPLVTMDAGANIHLLTRQDQVGLLQNITDQWAGKYRVFAGSKT